MLRIRLCRLRGSASGAVVLRAAPDPASGGPLALVESGGRLRRSASGRQPGRLAEEARPAERRARWSLPPAPRRAADGPFHALVTQAPGAAELRVLPS